MPGPSFNYVVTVYPTPMVTSPATYTVCDYNVLNYLITFNTPSTYFTWSRAAVAGISNIAVSGQNSGMIGEALTNTTSAPVDVTYVITSNTSTCTGITFNLVVTVYPNAMITSDASQNVCTGVPANYAIQSNVSSATYVWSRDAVAGISNPPVTNQTSNNINETLINTSATQVRVVYNIIPYAFGCEGTPFQYSAIVNPIPATPVASSNSPVCVGSTINLTTDSIQNATYLWTGPNGFTSTSRTPSIGNVTTANAGQYDLAISINGCSSPLATVTVAVDEPPVANAGPDQLVCRLVPSVQLAGNVSGGTTTGIWSTAGSGTFSPSNTALNAQYTPSAADTTAGSVILTLTSTSADNCAVATSAMTIKFGVFPVVDAGNDLTTCGETTGVQLNGNILIPGGGLWTTSGTGTFSPSASQLNAQYIPSAADLKNDSVTLVLRAVAADACYIPTDTTTIHFEPPPVVSVLNTQYILKGSTITLDPTVNETDVSYLWSPNIDINNATVKDPVITGDHDQIYTLTVTDKLGCATTVQVYVKIAPPLVVPNTFTPNNDGINDYWDIVGLTAYQQATIDIFTRWGQKVYHSIGYDKPWDGTLNNQRLPVGVYYYVIDTKFNGLVLSGYITLIR